MTDAREELLVAALYGHSMTESQVMLDAYRVEILREASLELQALDLPQQVLDMGPVAASCARAALLAAAALISPDKKED